MHTNDFKILEQMTIGESGLISKINHPNLQIRHRFMDLGIAPYATIKLLKKIRNRLYIIEVDDVEICIRRKDASLIEVKVGM
jgi:Fe2+ transport system protein FeoA